MNVLLWIFQIALAVHTVMGAAWKLSNPSEQAIPSLSALPGWVWSGLSVMELFLAVGLVLPLFKPRLGIVAPVSATIIALEMFLYSAVHLTSGEPNNSPVIYWMVVVAVCAFIALGRFILRPTTQE